MCGPTRASGRSPAHGPGVTGTSPVQTNLLVMRGSTQGIGRLAAPSASASSSVVTTWLPTLKRTAKSRRPAMPPVVLTTRNERGHRQGDGRDYWPPPRGIAGVRMNAETTTTDYRTGIFCPATPTSGTRFPWWGKQDQRVPGWGWGPGRLKPRGPSNTPTPDK